MFGRKSGKARSRRNAYLAPPKKRFKPVKSIQMLMKMREKAGVSRYKMATLAWVDEKYVKRLELGEARHPGRDVLIRLSRALVEYTKMFTEKDVDRVLAAAGFAPAPEPK